MSLRKTLNANIPTSGGAAQWIRALVGNRKVVDSQFGSRIFPCVAKRSTRRGGRV